MIQFYLVRVSMMTTSDECDMVASWSGVIAEKDMANIDLSLSADLLKTQLEGVPATNVRPMTEDEIREWRRGQET